MILKMSEMFHPPVGSFELDNNLERQFAETTHTVIANYSNRWTVTGEDPTAVYDEIVTPRFDIELSEETVMSVRVRVMDQHFAHIDAMASGGLITHKSTGRAGCVGLVLEYATYEQQQIEDYAENLDDFVSWQSYVFVGIEVTPETIITTVLDAQTGKELSLDDLLSAYNVLLALKSNLEAEEFSSDMAVHYEMDVMPLDEPEVSLSFDEKFADIFDENYIDSRYCAQCGKPTVYCIHKLDIKN